MFKREHHRRIHKLLSALDADLFRKAHCFFGGGTAIVLSLDEYRESIDVDFLCSSIDGYRELRNSITQQSLGTLLKTPVKNLRDIKMDQYGIRTILEIDNVAIKFEIVNEARIDLEGVFNKVLGIVQLTAECMFAEKLLANADRGLDKASMSRDIIDIAMMLKSWDGIPNAVWEKVRRPYGASVDKAYEKTVSLITNDSKHLAECLSKMKMDPNLVNLIPAILENHPAPPKKAVRVDSSYEP